MGARALTGPCGGLSMLRKRIRVQRGEPTELDRHRLMRGFECRAEGLGSVINNVGGL